MQIELFGDRKFYDLTIRRQNDLSSLETQLATNAQLNGISPLEAWTANGTNKDLSYSTHGVFRFFGKFPPPIATYLIRSYTSEGDLVWDPMCGSGTTGVEALLDGRCCYLSDVSYLNVLMARVKTRHVGLSRLQDGLTRIRANYKPIAKNDSQHEPIGLRNPSHWFLDETANCLRGLRAAIDEELDQEVKEAFLVAFCATVRRVSRATTQQGRLFLDVATALEDAFPTFLDKASRIISAVSALPSERNEKVQVLQHDLREPFAENFLGSANLVIMHPPYFNSYKYSRINSLELAWLGVDPAEVRQKEVREFFKVGKPEKVSVYVDDMARSITNAAALLKRGGVLALMIGDTVLKGSHIPTTRMILDQIARGSLKVETIALRVPKYTEATWVASQRRKGRQVGVTLYDYVIVFKRAK